MASIGEVSDYKVHPIYGIAWISFIIIFPLFLSRIYTHFLLHWTFLDALDSHNNKLALQICNKHLKKQPDALILLVSTP